MAEHNKFGALSELEVVSYLEKKGYSVLHTNWRSGHKEIDLIAMDGAVLVIVEVKARKSTTFGMPFEAVDQKKIRNLVSAADSYVKMNDLNCDVRFDIISLIAENDKTPEIIHCVDAFYPPIN